MPSYKANAHWQQNSSVLPVAASGVEPELLSPVAPTPPDAVPDPAQACPGVSACCLTTIALVQALRVPRRCPVCLEEYVPGPVRLLGGHVAQRPGLDLREGEVPEPTGRHQRLDVRGTDDSAEVRAVRRLLCELRPRGAGPDDDPEAVAQVKPSAPMRDQGGLGGHGGVPKGAFGRQLGADELDVPARITRVSTTNARAALSLSHLRQKGTLRLGFGALCVGVAHAVAEGWRRAKWDADLKRGWDRARVWGAARVSEAIEAWEATA